MDQLSMRALLSFLGENAAGIGLVGAAVAFSWSVIQFALVRVRDERHREFEIYHRLIKELVSPDPEGELLWIDRQCAVLFELRRFIRYHELTLRTLLGLRHKWTNDPGFNFPRLLEELQLTIDYIQSRTR
jgi:hypothetical protein